MSDTLAALVKQTGQFKVGDHVLYVLPRAPKNGRPVTRYELCRIYKITPKRICVEFTNRVWQPRYTTAASLVLNTGATFPPEEAR